MYRLKQVDAILTSNYRAISVLPVFSKIFENKLYMVDYILIWNKKLYSTYMVLTILIDKITSAIDKGEHDTTHFRFRKTI